MTAHEFTREPLTDLAERIRYATGIDRNRLRDITDHGDPVIGSVLTAYRDLFRAEQAVTFHRESLNGLSSGRYEIDRTFVPRLQRTLRALEQAVADRDLCREQLICVLEPLEHIADQRSRSTATDVPAADLPALLAISHGGAVLRENLLSHRVTVVTSSGRRISWTAYQRLETAGLVTRDPSHPLHAGQPVSLTTAGRAALAQPRATTSEAPATARRSGAFPIPTSPPRR